MGLTVTAGPSWWWLHVLFLGLLQHTWVISQESTPTNETHWSNVTTGSYQVHISNNEISGTPNTTLDRYWGNVTTRPDQVYITGEETSRTPNSTLDSYWGNVTTEPDQVYITSQKTSGTPSPTIEMNLSDNTTGPDLVYTTNEEISTTLNNTVQTNMSNVTTGPDLVYNTSAETSGTPNTTLETYPSHVTADLDYITSDNSNVTTGPGVAYVTSRTTNSPLETYPNNVTTGPDLNYTHEETSRTPNTTPEVFPSNVGPHPTYVTEDTIRIPNSTIETYPSNVTAGPDLVLISEISTTPNTTIETPNTATTSPDLGYITEETTGTPNTTMEIQNTATTSPDLGYITEETYRTPNTTLEIQNTMTASPDLEYITEETTGSPNTTIETPNTATTSPDLGYITEETSRTLNTTMEIPSTATTSPDLGYITEETTGTPYENGTFYTGAMYCLQDADCPPYTVCTEQGGRRVCQCHLGSYLHHELGCVTVRTFPALVPSSILFWDETSVNSSEYISNEDESAQYLQGVYRAALLFQNVLGHVPGYLSTSITNVQLDEGLVTIVHSFSTLYPVTEDHLWGALFCTEPHPGCVSPLSSDTYQGLSLCDFDVCDSSSSDCRSHGGLVTCECRRGYYKFSPTDRSCRACGSGFRRTENGCDRCPIGYGGFDCEESYLLVVIVESCVGCVLLVSLITLLIFYFRRKEPQKPMFIDSIVLGVPTDQPSVRLPRAQFSWRREWEWNEPQEKVLADIHQQPATPDGPAIHMKTFGDPARFSSPNTYHGRHNLSFISD